MNTYPLAVDSARLPGVAMLFALGRTRKHVYAGTVPAAEKARRRKANKAARVARRAGRAS